MTNSEFIDFFFEVKSLSIAETTADSYKHILQRLLQPNLEVGSIGFIDRTGKRAQNGTQAVTEHCAQKSCYIKRVLRFGSEI